MEKRAVYCMNLEDSRAGNEDIALSQEKFVFCLRRQVIGIGSIPNKETDESDSDYDSAKKYISALNPGDLVWIKKPGKDKYYIAEIAEGEPYTAIDSAFAKYDLSYCRNCKFRILWSGNNVPEKYADDIKKLIVHGTIQPITDAALVDFVNDLWENITIREKQSHKTGTGISKMPRKSFKEIVRSPLFIVLLCVIVGIAAFFSVHQIVTNRSTRETKEMNEELQGQTFVSDQGEEIRVWSIKSDGLYDEKVYEIDENNNNTAKLKSTVEEKPLSYDISIWGELWGINDGTPQFDSNGNVIKIGEYSLATEEQLSMIQQADERELTKHKLSDFIMTLDEYRDVYKASGLPVTDKLIDLDLEDFCILYKQDPELILITDNGIPDENTVRLISDSADGKNRGYDYMMRPILLYLKSIPGALTDINEIVDRWDAAEEEANFAGEIVSEFTHNGITYCKSEFLTHSRMYIEISVDKNHEIYLADYPEFTDKVNT